MMDGSNRRRSSWTCARQDDYALARRCF
jgi:hypothetical protein